jgi:hypothetical protein
MKKLFVSIIILTLATGESHAQWKGFTDILNPATLGVIDSTLFAYISGSDLFRLQPSPQVWIQADTGMGSNQGITAYSSIGSFACVGTQLGNFYRSTDTGKHWAITGYGLPTAFGYVSNFVTIDSTLFMGYAGIWRSIDSGVHWTESDSGLNGSGSVTFLATLGTNMFASGGGGVYRSIDSGHHWITTNFPTGGVLGLAVIGTDIFAANSDGGVYRSTDGGGHWTECDNG